MTNSRNLKPAIHSRFYEWLTPCANGGRVLDAGCGDGLGAAILARTASEVVAIDRDPAAIEQAAKTRGRPNVDYQVMDCQHLQFEDGSFDLVASNAVFEYLEDVDGFVAEAARVLRPGGRFVCGTKNLLGSMRRADGSPLYRNHLQEFDPPQLEALLAGHLGEIRLYGETMSDRAAHYINDRSALRIERFLVALGLKHVFPVSWRKRVKRKLTGIDVPDIGVDDFEIEEGNLDEAFYLVGVGVKASPV